MQRSVWRWHRLFSRLRFLLISMARSAVLDYWQQSTLTDQELPHQAPPSSRGFSSRRLPRRDDLSSIGRPLEPSRVGGYRVSPDQCTHPLERMKARGGAAAQGGRLYWWTCADCGNRWERISAEESAQQQDQDRQRAASDDMSMGSATGAAASSAVRPPQPPTRTSRAPITPNIGIPAPATPMPRGYAGTPAYGAYPRPGHPPAPFCPACGAVMVFRRNRSHDGTFWGCSMFPRCRATRPGPRDAQEYDMPADDAETVTSDGQFPDHSSMAGSQAAPSSTRR